MGGLGSFIESATTYDKESLSDVEFAETYFLNPTVPYATEDDPDGSHHFNLHVSDAQGNPMEGLKKDEPIPLRLRDYQRRVVEHENKWRVLRFGRRVGKTFLLGVEAVTHALRNSNAQVLILAPNQSHIKVLFDDYIRPMLRVYKHDRTGEIGITEDVSEVGEKYDYALEKDTQKPQEVVIVGEGDHRASIRGMVINDSARGQSASKLIFDEADYADTEMVQAVVAPIIMTRPNTEILMSSTPTGRTDTFYYDKCQDDDWKEFHETFEVLPHFDQDLYDRMAKLAGGENTNTFKQEYLAKWGSATEGVFNQDALRKSYIVSPYCKVLEKLHRKTGEREPLLAMDRNEPQKDVKAHYDAVERTNWNVQPNPLGSRSVYQPRYRGNGVVTAGTDWNEEAGMQTVLVWWPPAEWIRQGKVKVARFEYDQDGVPNTSSRDKAGNGTPKRLAVGRDNGDPGGIHDLREVRGIVIWHGRLEGTAHFNWTAAANRVAGIMSIPNFVDTWYVDKGYGRQVNQMIREIMASGEYRPDQKLLSQSVDIPDPLLRNINQFHPEKEGKTFKPIDFSARYEHEDFDFMKGKGSYKAVMVNLAQRMISEHKLLLPYGELVGYYGSDELGSTYQERIDKETAQKKRVAQQVTNDDKIDDTGGAKPRGETGIGGLVNQMQAWQIDGRSPTGKPRFSGIDHTIDGLMLAILGYWEQHSREREGNMFRQEGKAPGGSATDVLGLSQQASRNNRPDRDPGETVQEGEFTMKEYGPSDDPFDEIVHGNKSPRDVGTSLEEMQEATLRHYRKKAKSD
jgi:hypothetical protein